MQDTSAPTEDLDYQLGDRYITTVPINFFSSSDLPDDETQNEKGANSAAAKDQKERKRDLLHFYFFFD